MSSPRWFKRLAQLRSEPAWQVWVEDEWICPYCGSVAVRAPDGANSGSSEATTEAMARHLEQNCPHFKSLDEPTVALKTLKTKARELALGRQIRLALRREKSWQFLDEDRHWYCPFCARPADIKVPEGNRVGRRTIDKIRAHLESCFAYERGKGKSKSAEKMRQIVREANRQRKMTEQIRLRLERDPSWRQRDGNSRWLCPYCKQSVEHIEISSRLVLLEQAPGQIAAHLLNACVEFDAKGLSQGEMAPVAARPESSAIQAVDWKSSIKTDLEAVRAQVGESASRSGSWSATSEGLNPVAAPLPKIPGFELSLFFRPVKGMAGDFYDVFEVGGGRYGILLGDVTGDGPDTGLAVEMTRSLIHIHLNAAEGSPVRLLKLVNRDLAKDLDSKNFASVFLGVLDPAQKSYTYARAGYQQPLRVRRRNAAKSESQELAPSRRMTAHSRPGKALAAVEIEPLEGEGLVLGVDGGEVFDSCLEERRIELETGDLIVHASPGILSLPAGAAGSPLGGDGFRGLVQRYGRHEAEYLSYKLRQIGDEHPNELLRDDSIVLSFRVE